MKIAKELIKKYLYEMIAAFGIGVAIGQKDLGVALLWVTGLIARAQERK